MIKGCAVFFQKKKQINILNGLSLSNHKAKGGARCRFEMKVDETNTPYDIHHSLEQVVFSLQKNLGQCSIQLVFHCLTVIQMGRSILTWLFHICQWLESRPDRAKCTPAFGG